MNQAEQLHPLKKELQEKVPEGFHTVVDYITRVSEAVSILQEISDISQWEASPDVDDFYNVLEQRKWFQTRVNETLSLIPSHGPLVVAANHPYPMLDGLALLHQIKMVRPGKPVKFIGNQATSLIPEMDGICISTPDKTKESTRDFNDQVDSLLGNEWAVIIFPRGEANREGIWKPGFRRIAERNSSPIQPAYVHSPLPSVWYLIIKKLYFEGASNFNLAQALRRNIEIWINFWEVIDSTHWLSAWEMKKIVYRLK